MTRAYRKERAFPDLPAEAEKNRRKQQINLRVTPEELEILQEFMREHGIDNRNQAIVMAIKNLRYG